jgi:hypothetical protein
VAAGREDLDRLRDDVARVTRRGIGMTLAASLYWLGMAVVSAFAGLQPGPLALFFLFGTLLVYPLGWLLTRRAGGDLFARGHPLRGAIVLFAATQVLAWPLLATLFLRDRALVAFALAAMLGAHFLPYGWLYRSRTYLVLGVGSVVLAAVLQWGWPARANLAIALGMAACYALAVGGVWRENRRRTAGRAPAR